MNNFYVPYTGDLPAAVTIKGHRFVILCHDRLVLEDNLDLLGADSLREFNPKDPREEDEIFDTLAEEVDGGIVVAPTDMEISFVIDNLRAELPWIH